MRKDNWHYESMDFQDRSYIFSLDKHNIGIIGLSDHREKLSS